MDEFNRGMAVGMLFGNGKPYEWPDAVECTHSGNTQINLIETWNDEEHDDLEYKVMLTQERVSEESTATITKVTRIVMPDNSYILLTGFYPDRFLYTAVTS